MLEKNKDSAELCNGLINLFRNDCGIEEEFMNRCLEKTERYYSLCHERLSGDDLMRELIDGYRMVYEPFDKSIIYGQ